MGCRRRAPRDALTRIVRTPAREIALDTAGTAPGRGAYVCSTMECIDRATRRGRLSHALRAEVDGQAIERLKKEFVPKGMNDCGARSAEQAR